MCMTWDHSFGAHQQEIFPDVIFGLSDTEKKALRNNMAQVFDNDIAPLLKKHATKKVKL